MALTRLWRPSPNCSSGLSPWLACCHTSEGSTSESGLASYLANPSSQVSYHCIFDDQGDPNTITECVRVPNKAWAAMNANSWAVHGCCCTPSGASAGWSRNDWMARPTMLAKCAAWIGEECRRYGIPLVKISAGDIQAGRKGVCGHGDVSAAGAGGSHFDPGAQFPWDHVLALAGGVAPTPEPKKDDDMPKAFLMQAPGQPVYLVAIDLQSKLAIPTPDRLNDVLWISKQQTPPLLVDDQVTPTTAEFLAMIPDAAGR